MKKETALTSIGGGAFNDCKAVERIYLPDSVQTVGDSAFHGCSTATFYVEFPSRPEGRNVNWIEDYALKDQVIREYKN